MLAYIAIVKYQVLWNTCLQYVICVKKKYMFIGNNDFENTSTVFGILINIFILFHIMSVSYALYYIALYVVTRLESQGIYRIRANTALTLTNL